MMQHEIQDLNLITDLKFTVLALRDTIMLVTQILHPYHSVWQIGNFDTGTWLEISRTDFLFWCIKVGVSFVLDLRQLFPMGIAEIAGDGIKGAGMRRSLILCKAYKSFQRSCTYTNACPTLNVERQEFTI